MSAGADENGRALGVRIFAPGVEPRFRRRRLLFLAIYLAVVVGVVTPALPGAWAGRPGLLGVPVSFQWVIAVLVVVFLALAWLFRTEPPEAEIVSAAGPLDPEG